jgi:hypothetical protein
MIKPYKTHHQKRFSFGLHGTFSSKPLGRVCILDAGPLSLEVPLALKGAPGTKWTKHGMENIGICAKSQIPASEDHQTC